MRIKETLDINFRRGINNWNRQLERATSPAAGYDETQPYQLRPNPEGFVDDILNMTFDDEGRLIGRNPVTFTNMGTGNFPNTSGQRAIRMLTHPAHYSGKDIDVGSFLVGTVDLASVTNWIFLRNGLGTNSHSHTYTFDTGSVLHAIYYNGFWWIYAPNTGHGIVKLADNNVKTTQTLTLATLMSIAGVTVFKDRAWAWGSGNILQWSKATDPGTWTAPDGGFIKLPTDIKDIVPNNDQLYILTTDSSIYTFSFSSDPATDGYLRKVIEGSALPGAGGCNLCVSDGELYTAGTYNVYRIVNNTPISIADQLHLDINAYTNVKLWDCGTGLLLRTYYYVSSSDKNQQLYFYSYSAEAWTRLEFPVYPNDTDTAKVFLEQAHLRVQQNFVNLCMAFGNGADVNSTFAPLMDWWVTYPNFDNAFHDNVLTSYTGGFPTQQYRTIKHRLKTGPVYTREPKDSYKRFWNFLFDAYLNWWVAGDTPNNTPYIITVDYIPQAMTPKTLQTLQKGGRTDEAESQYVIPINQRARAVSFTWETEDIQTWTVEQNPDSATESSDARPVIHSIKLLYDPIQKKRFLSPSTAGSDARNY